MNYDRVVAATMESQAVSGADLPIIELQLPADTTIEVIRVEIGAAEGATPLDEMQEIALYWNSTAGTGGTALTEFVLNGGGTVSTAALRNLTAIGGGSSQFYHSGFHWQNGWLYLPVPEERVVIKPAVDVFGFLFPTAPQVATTFSATVVFGEVG